MNDKITSDMILEWEADSLIDAVGNCLELNDIFLKRYCNKEFYDLLIEIPECDREFVLSGIDIKHTWNGFPPNKDWQHIWLDVGEIEYQFEGDPINVFEDINDFTINGDLAYLYTGYGLSLEFDHSQLIEAIQDYKENYQNES